LNLTELRAALATLDLRPSKTLGQNFLHDQNLAAWVVRQGEIGAGDHLFEIGPGLGALTRAALPLCRSATLVERDGRLAAYLERELPPEKARVIHADGATFDLGPLFAEQPVVFLGNLPYSASSPILFNACADPSPFSRMVLTLQKEVADRLVAGPRTKEYGLLAVLIGLRWRIELLRKLPPSVFFPAPKVDSATVRLSPRPPGDLPDFCRETCFRIVRAGFAQRRKQLGKLLAPLGIDWGEAARAAGVSPLARAEDLSPEEWIALSEHLAPVRPARAQDGAGERFPVVDECDRQIGAASRAEVHARGLRHRAIHAFVFDRTGRLFLQKRSRWKDVHPGKWDSSASGHVEDGCGYDETAAREIAEELGVECAPERIGAVDACAETGQEFVKLYAARHEGPFRLPPAEIESGRFFDLATLDRWIARRPEDFATGFLACYRAYRAAGSAG
jgi:16S rRNA (adenine1518-N6/adenine1519-N6)-dimethyltransferase